MPPTPAFGLAPFDQVATMSGREVLEAIAGGRFPQPPICERLNFRLVSVGEGTAVFEGDTGPDLFNPMGTVHGGWALTLIDSAAGCAGYTLLPAGTGYTTVETKANFSRPILANTGRVRAEAKIVSQGRQIMSAEAWVRSAEGKVLAHGTSTLLVIAPK